MTHSLQAIDMSLPIGSLDAYIHRVNQIPILTLEQEKELTERTFRDQDLEAARQLVMAHLRYVVRVARGYMGYGLPLGDLIQEGNVGLMKAVKRFDPKHEVRLVSFAVHWIKAEIHEFILRNWRIVKVATTKAQRKLFFNLRSYKKRLGWFTNEEVNAVAKDLNVNRRDVLEMEKRLNAVDMSLYAENDDDDDAGGSSWAPEHYLEAPDADPALAFEHDQISERNQYHLAAALKQLDERSLDILQARWLTEDKKATLHELAAKYDISAERIRQLEQNAMKKLKDMIMGQQDIAA